jgi:hypothetical protein
MAVLNNPERRSTTMFQQEEMSYERKDAAYGYEGDIGFGYASPSSMAGQILSGPVPGEPPTAVQRLALALVSLGMLMGMIILLTILAVATSAPGWVAFPLLFVLTLFAAAAVSINVVFNRRVW